MLGTVAVVISGAAFAVSLLTAWLTFFRRGTVRLTQPTVIYFGPDAGAARPPKVYFRALLFATARRGRVIESMHVRLRRADTTQNFTIWVYGDKELVRGSGIFVPEAGVVANHHFLIQGFSTPFAFTSGTYELSIIAGLVGERVSGVFFRTVLELSYQAAVVMAEGAKGVMFDWSPDRQSYSEHLHALRSVPAGYEAP